MKQKALVNHNFRLEWKHNYNIQDKIQGQKHQIKDDVTESKTIDEKDDLTESITETFSKNNSKKKTTKAPSGLYETIHLFL